MSGSPSLSFLYCPEASALPWTNYFILRFQEDKVFSSHLNSFVPIRQSPVWKSNGNVRQGVEMRLGTPLVALNSWCVKVTALPEYIEIYASEPAKSQAPRHSCSCFEAVRKLLAASYREQTPLRAPPHAPLNIPTPVCFKPTCGELIHCCGGRLTATSFEPPPSPPHPPPVVAISFQAPLVPWRRGQTGKHCFFFLECVRRFEKCGTTAASVMEKSRSGSRVCRGVEPLTGQMGNPAVAPLPSTPCRKLACLYRKRSLGQLRNQITSSFLCAPPPSVRERVCMCVFVEGSSSLNEECMTYTVGCQMDTWLHPPHYHFHFHPFCRQPTVSFTQEMVADFHPNGQDMMGLMKINGALGVNEVIVASAGWRWGSGWGVDEFDGQ